MTSQNFPMGDTDFGTSVPETQVPDGASTEIQNAAKFSKSKEFQALKTHLEQRIDFYQKYLPDGRVAAQIDNVETIGAMWIAANAIVGEFKAVISAYEQAAKIIADEKKNQ